MLPLPTDAVATLVARDFPGLAGQPVTAVASGGTVNTIFRVGAGATARFPREPDASHERATTLRGEAVAAAAFGAATSVPTPRPLGVGRPSEHYPGHWSAQTWIAGDVATPTACADSGALAEDLARLIGDLRAVDTERRPFSGEGRGGRLATHDAWVATCLEESEGLLDTPALGRLWAAFREYPPPGALAMCHKDLIPGNVLVRDGRLAGVLDAGDYGPADPALDLVCAWHLFDAGPRAHLRQRLRAGREEWMRGAGWAFQQAIGLVWYYRESLPAMSESGRTTLARLLGDREVRAVAGLGAEGAGS